MAYLVLPGEQGSRGHQELKDLQVTEPGGQQEGVHAKLPTHMLKHSVVLHVAAALVPPIDTYKCVRMTSVR